MWKNLKGLFVTEEVRESSDAHKPEGSSNRPLGAGSNTAVNPSFTSPASAATNGQGEVSDEFIQALIEAMERANLTGFDYLEYKKSLQNLKRMNFSDEIRYQSAFATAQSMGVTTQDLLKSANHYLDVLNNEHGKFDQALKSQRERQVTGKREQLRQLDQRVEQQEARIAELQQQIDKTRAQRTQLQGSIDKSVRKLEKTQADFRATYSVIVESIKADIAKVRNFLK